MIPEIKLSELILHLQKLQKEAKEDVKVFFSHLPRCIKRTGDGELVVVHSPEGEWQNFVEFIEPDKDGDGSFVEFWFTDVIHDHNVDY